MKTMDIIRSFAALMVGCAVLAACSKPEPDPEPDQKVTPVFPTAVENSNVAPGSTLSLTFTPNMDWELSVPTDNLQWFWLLDSGMKSDKVKGTASESAVTVSIGVSETEEFDKNRSCEVTLTMGGESKVIAKYMRPAKSRTLTAYAAKVADGALVYAEDGSGIVYETVELQSIDLMWSDMEAGFALPVKVESNFEWTAEFPVWARADIPEVKTGVVNFNVYSVPSELPLDNETGNVVFKSATETVKEYGISIPGCKDRFSYSFNGYSSVEYDYAGYYKGSDTYSNEAILGWIYGPSASRVAVAEVVDGKYKMVDTPSWINLEVDVWDNTSGAPVLQTRGLSVSVTINDGAERKAAVFFLPATFGDDCSKLFTSDMTGLSDEFRRYAVAITQAALPDNYLTPDESMEVMEAAGVIFGKSSDSSLLTAFGNAPYAYELSYTKSYSREKAYMRLTTPFASYSVYGSDKKEVTGDALESFWLGFTLLSGDNYGVIDMIEDNISGETAEGYIVFKDSKGQNLAVVHCTYVKEKKEVVDVTVDASDDFVDKDAAAAAGATLVEVTAGPTYEAYKENQCPVKILKYTRTDTALEIKVPEMSMRFTVNPWSKVRAVSVDGKYSDEGGELLEWDDAVNSYVGTFDGTVDIAMAFLDGASSGSETANVLFYDKNNKVVLTLICVLDVE